MNSLGRWMLLATRWEQQAAAGLAGTTRNYLYQLGGGRRKASRELAERIVFHCGALGKASKGRLPRVAVDEIVSASASLRRDKQGAKE